MSCTELYVARADGDLALEAEFQNSWLGGMAIWNAMARQYCGYDTFPMFDAAGRSKVWALAGNEKVPEQDRVTLATTLDRFLVPGDALVRVAECLEHSAGWMGRTHLRDQAACLRELAAAGDVRAVGWNQSSVTYGYWLRQDEGAEESRPYNIDRDTEHHWLFESVCAKAAPEVPCA